MRRTYKLLHTVDSIVDGTACKREQFPTSGFTVLLSCEKEEKWSFMVRVV